MDSHEVNNGRRRFLVLATSGAGGVAALDVAAPFVASFLPSERVKTAGIAVEIDVSKIESGQMMTAEWQGKPIWVVNRAAQQLKGLKAFDGIVNNLKPEVEQQPENCKSETRSTRPNIFVAVGVCTHLGCPPTHRPSVTPADLKSAWKDGFFYPCHGLKFDMAGRVHKGVPTPTNSVVPLYKYLSNTTVLVGEA